MGRRGTGVYKHSYDYKESTNTGVTNKIPDSVHQDFKYDAETGKLYWTVITPQRQRNNGEAGTVKHCVKTGAIKHRRIHYKNKNYTAHRIIYYMHHGHCPDMLDHIDGNPLNNLIGNLRPADPTLNSWNQKTFKNNTSGITGVVWNKAVASWRSRITCKGVVYELGFTDSKFEAACLRKSAELKMFGSFQRV